MLQSLKRATSLLPAASRLICGLSTESHIEKIPKNDITKERRPSHHLSIPRIYSTCSTSSDAGNEEAMPKHVGVILDGNGRWAKKRGLAVEDGHLAGIAALRNLISYSSDLGIKVLTVFAFSVENWKRSQREIEIVMEYIESSIKSHVMELIQQDNIRFSVIGNRSQLPQSLQSTISSAEEAGRANKGMHFVMAINYSGRNEIATACKKIAMQVEQGLLEAKEVDERVVERNLMTSSLEFPDLDLLIRTSGELRVSNFMLWQLAYSEMYFANKMFPDFGKDDFVEALASFKQRQRRYGERNT